MALDAMGGDKNKKKQAKVVFTPKVELTPNPTSYASFLGQPTTSIPSGTIANTTNIIAKTNKLKAMSKKDLTAKEYYNPPPPTYKSGNIELDILSSNPWLMDVPIIGNKIKDKAYEMASQRSSALRSMEDINNPKNSGGNKYTGMESENSNIDLVKQYIYNNQGLSPSPFTPKDDYYNFLPSYSLQNKLGNSLGNRILKNLDPDKLKDLEEVSKTHKPKFYSDDAKSPNIETTLFYDKQPNLGHYKSGFGYDESVGLPYASISDAWDFYPKDYANDWGETKLDGKDVRSTSEYQQAYLMHKAGKPFKIYDRIYIDPKTKSIIPNEQILKMKQKIK